MNRTQLDANQLKAAHPHNSAWVEANAGAGKTQVLSNRIARLLLAGAEPANILCLTYTKAGAAEMAERIYGDLSDWTALDDTALAAVLEDIGVSRAGPDDLTRARRLFALALDTPGGFKIQTIHGFCERILQLFPVEAKMSPGFEILDETKRKELFEQARDEVLGAAQATPGGELAAALQLVGEHATSDALRGLIDEMLSNAALNGTASDNSHAGMIEDQLRRFFGLDETLNLEEVKFRIIDCDDASIIALADEMIATRGADNIERGQALKAFCCAQDPASRITALKSQMLLDGKGTLRKPPKVDRGKLTQDVQQRLRTQLQEVYGLLVTLLQQHDELVRIEATKALSVIANAVIKRFRAAKARRAAYDFDDLIEKTKALLTDQAAAAWVLYKLDKAIEHVLVDEAQDTSPPQWQIMKALTEEFFAGEGQSRQAHRTIFVVGDQKQSIFSFQGANIRTFAETQAYFASRSKAAQQPMANVPLTVSYRSLDAVLKSVDTVFKDGTPARLSLGIAGGEGLDHVRHRTAAQGIVELWPLVVAEDSEEFDKWRAPWQVQEQRSPELKLARQIAATIASWIGKRRLTGTTRAVRPDDILLLFRARNRMFDLMITALREAGVPVAGADRLVPAENIAVEDMLALMRVMTLPQDDYALACLMKSPLVTQPLNEEQLFALAHARGKATLWERLGASSEPAALSAIADLESWKVLARECRPYEFITRVLMKRRSHILARLGGEASDALKAMGEQALAYEREHGASLAGFEAWFRAETSQIKRDMDKGQGEVRLMTVHGAKGLEAGIVFLPDAASYKEQDRESLLFVSAQGGGGDVPLWKVSSKSRLMPSNAIDSFKDEKRTATHSEYTRLLYVAMTRARDELYICGACNKDGAKPESWYGMVSAALTGERMRQAESPFAGKVRRCGDEPDWQVKAEAQTNAYAVDVPLCLSEPFTAKQKMPSASVAPSRMAHGELLDAAAAKTGRMLHRILERLPAVAVEERRDYVERQLKRAGIALAMADRLLAVLDQPDLQPLFGPAARAEVNIVTSLPDGTPFSGVIDRMVEREQDILLVDYKSDAAVPERTGAGHPYVQQLAGYCFALQKLYPGKPIRAGIMWLSETRLDWLDPADMAGTLAALQGARITPA